MAEVQIFLDKNLKQNDSSTDISRQKFKAE
jgi:hypothetical protein